MTIEIIFNSWLIVETVCGDCQLLKDPTSSSRSKHCVWNKVVILRDISLNIWLETPFSYYFLFFFQFFVGHMSFCGANDTPDLNFWWQPSGFQSQSGQAYSHLAESYMMHIPEIHLWCNTCWRLDGEHSGWLRFPAYYRPCSEASEGYVFTGVCHSLCSTRGDLSSRGFCLNTYFWGRPPKYIFRQTPQECRTAPRKADLPERQTLREGRPHPQRTDDPTPPPPPRKGRPPEEENREYGQWAGGTHPTGMHPCYYHYYHITQWF